MGFALFSDRRDAGRRLAEALSTYRGQTDVVMLGLPRGGVVVAGEAARSLGLPLDVLAVRKLGVPAQPELAFGAVGEEGVVVLNEPVIRSARLNENEMRAVLNEEERELERRIDLYRRGHPALEIAGKTAILVDDGLATGSTMLAAGEVARRREARAVVVAVPVAAADTVQLMKKKFGAVECVHVPVAFSGVGEWYADFSQISDETVRDELDRARLS